MNTSHYPSLELCKKLRDNSFPFTFQDIHAFGQVNTNDSPDYQNDVEWCPAPSVMELLDEMPKRIHIRNGGLYYYVSIDDIGYPGLDYDEESLPNALAEMWLWLKENKYISTLN